MATIRLIPSTYYLSNSSYLSVSNASNMYNNTDNDTYSTTTNSQTGTSSYYIYLRGFNFDDIPDAAVVSSFSVKFKARESGVSTSSSYRPYMCNNTTTITGTCSAVSTTATVQTFSDVTADWETIKGYGSNFGIRFNCRRSSRNTTSYMYLYGAEIEVEYTIPDPRTITTTLTGDGTISPSGTNTYYDGDEIELVITPTNTSDAVTATRDGVDITDQLVAHGPETSISAAPADVSTSGIQSGSSYASYAVGHTAESPSSSGTSSNMYASSSSTGYAEYTFDLSSIPSGAIIESVTATCYGHRESSTVSSTYVSKVGIYESGTLKSDETEFPSTSNSTIIVTSNDVSSTNITVRHTVGYYGGLVLGITLTVEYSTGGSTIDHYTYTFTVSGDVTIAVVIGGSGETSKFYVKIGTAYYEVETGYQKVNGTYVEQTVDALANIFSNNNILKGG